MNSHNFVHFANNVLLLISLNFPPEIGGGATGAWNRALMLRKIGFNVFILCGFPSYPTGKVVDKKYKGKLFYLEKIDGFTVIRIKTIPLSNSGFIKPFLIFMTFILMCFIVIPKLKAVMPNAAIVYARSPIVFCSVIGFVYSRLMHSVYIYEVPDIWPEELIVVKSSLLPLVMKIGKYIAKLSYMFSDIVITISESAVDYIIKEYRPKAPVYGIPSGVNQDKFISFPIAKSREELIAENIISVSLLNKFIVLYSGRLSSTQNVLDLAMAAEQLKDFMDIVILVIGEGPEKNKLRLLKEEKSLDNFILLEPVKRELMPKLISASNVCAVLLSSELIFKIAIPSKFYEYIGCQKPLVGVCQGELEKIIRNDNIGLTSISGDIDTLKENILKMRNSPDLLCNMTQNTVMTLNKFSIDVISETFKNTVLKKIGEVALKKSHAIIDTV